MLTFNPSKFTHPKQQMKTLLRKASALIVTAVLFGSTNFVSAQQSHFCGTDEKMAEMLKNNPDALSAQQELDAFTREYIRTHEPVVSERGGPPTYIIPIVFHIIHENGVENVSNNTIFQQVDTMTRDYRRLNPDTAEVQWGFQHLVADCNIEFRLAQKDPDGNCTNGIDRVYSYRTNQGDDRSKVVVWDRKNYLNVWVVKTLSNPNVAAYAYLPAGAAGLGYKVDGCIARYNYVGGTNRTLTHEIGHCFNLSHTWGGGTVATACGDDGVADTPVTEGATSCPSNSPNGKVDFTCSRDTIKKTYQFDSVTVASGTTEPNPPMLVVNRINADTALTLMNFSAVGLSANSATDSVFAFSGWDTGGINGDTAFYSHTDTINPGKYYEFTVRPQLGQGITLTGIRLFVKRSTTGPRMFCVRSSETNNFHSNLTSSVFPANTNISVRTDTLGFDTPNTFYFNSDTSLLLKGARITLSGALYTNTDDTVTFRIYAWNAEDAAGTFDIDSVALLGTFGRIENLDNYMDYTFCMNMFTLGQADRMHAALESSISFRNNLWTSANHTLTGIDNPQTCPPQADFYTNKSMACQNAVGNNTIQFFDNSTRGTVVSRTWTFPNGTPSTSTVANPIVTFNALWNQSATLMVTNSAGSTSITKNLVWVAPTWADYSGLFSEDFENASEFNLAWRVDNRSDNVSSWQVTNDGVFPSGTHGLRLNAFSPMILSTNTTPQIVLDWGIGSDDKDAFITPSFDLSHIINNGTGKLEFKLSGATRGTTPGDMEDTLRVFYSVNCGNTWTLFPASASVYSGALLCNAGSWQDYYTPSVLSQWVQKSINLPVQTLVSNVRFKFEYVSGDLSNNIYIDDVNISGAVGIEDINSAVATDLVVYPNPAGEDVSVTYRLSASRNVKLQIFDALGNLVYDLVNQKQAAGSYSVNFKTSKISNGVYYVKLSGDNVNLRTEKIVVIR